jgi:hypothetical protein
MICEECKKEGKKSTVRLGRCTATLMGFDPYWDKEGVYHDHDGNTLMTDYRCSNGHSWCEISKPNKCPGCNWPEEEKA